MMKEGDSVGGLFFVKECGSAILEVTGDSSTFPELASLGPLGTMGNPVILFGWFVRGFLSKQCQM